MRRCPGVILLVALMSAGGCAYRPRPVVLQAAPAEWKSMVGTWRGSYSTSNGRRRGLIDFTLAAGDGQAYGDVLMIPADSRDRYAPMQNGTGADGPRDVASTSKLLTIRFIRASDGRLMGAMTPYWDPDRGCEATATFYGAIREGRMEGTFTSMCAAGMQALKGRWTVERQREADR